MTAYTANEPRVCSPVGEYTTEVHTVTERGYLSRYRDRAT